MPENSRIYLSSPDLDETDFNGLLETIKQEGLGTSGSQIHEFESAVAKYCGSKAAAAVSSGTAGLHLALLAMGVKSGDEVVTSTFSFAATAFAIKYVGAEPVFIDIERESWNIDPELLDDFLKERKKQNKLPRLILTVDIYGNACNYQEILRVADKYGISVISDSAEALGAEFNNVKVGKLSAMSVFSFNGNKIITSSGGGMVVSDDESKIDHVRFLANQAKENVPWYEHKEIGFNYRMSNLLACVGSSQFKKLDSFVAKRKKIKDLYSYLFEDEKRISVKSEPSWGKSNNWLTAIELNFYKDQIELDDLIRYCDQNNIETRCVWKPLHKQEIFQNNIAILNETSENIFNSTLLLPSSSHMTDIEIKRVVSCITDYLNEYI